MTAAAISSGVRPAGPVTDRQIAAYSVAAFAVMFLAQPVTNFVPQLYAKEFGFSLAGLGMVLFAGRILDAVGDQVFGYLSDQTRSRWGARKPWIAVGATLTVISAFFLLKPPPGIGLIYFFVWRWIYDMSATMQNINYTAWGAELSSDYHTRSRITAFRGFSSQLGSVLNDLLPIVVAWIGLTASSSYSMEMMGYFFIVALLTIPLMTAFSLFSAPQGAPMPHTRPKLRGLFKSVKNNRPFLIYLASFVTTGLGLGVLQLMFTFYDGYLKVGQWYPYMMTAFSVVTVAAIPFWSWLSSKIGKHRAYSISMIVASLAMNGFWFVHPGVMGTQAVAIFASFVVIVMGIGVAASMVLPAAILADVIDYGTLKTGEVRTGSYFAFYLLTTKVAAAVGAAAGFMGLAAFGYDAKAGAVNDATANFGIMFTIVLVPTILKVTGALMVWSFPIDQRRHGIIAKRLRQRVARAEGAGPVSGAQIALVAPEAVVDAETPSGRPGGTP